MPGKKRQNFFQIREASLRKSVSGFEKHVIQGIRMRQEERIVERVGNGLFNQGRSYLSRCISSFACYFSVVVP